MPKREPMTPGCKIGRLTFVSSAPPKRTPGGQTFYRVHAICDCGVEIEINESSLRQRRTLSCGCLRRELITSHGMSRSRTYRIWSGMKMRGQGRGTGGAHYAARGITVCERWLDFPAFLQDMGEAPDGMEIDRIDNDRGYEPGNCRWTDRQTQVRNSAHAKFVEFDGERLCFTEAAARIGTRTTVISRKAVVNGWTMQQALDFFRHRLLDPTLGRKRSPEARARMKAAQQNRGPQTAETKAKISATLKGRVFTPEHLGKISASLKGKPRTSEHAAKIAASRRVNAARSAG